MGKLTTGLKCANCHFRAPVWQKRLAHGGKPDYRRVHPLPFVESIMAPRMPKDPAKTPVQAKPAPEKLAAAKPVAKSVGAEKAVKPAPKGGNQTASQPTGLKLRNLIDSVATATGTKKVDAKASVEATLAALAAALKSGADMTLPPLGKLRVVKLAEKNGATMMTLKLRHGGGQKPGAKPLADDGEDG